MYHGKFQYHFSWATITSHLVTLYISRKQALRVAQSFALDLYHNFITGKEINTDRYVTRLFVLCANVAG